MQLQNAFKKIAVIVVTTLGYCSGEGHFSLHLMWSQYLAIDRKSVNLVMWREDTREKRTVVFSSRHAWC